MYLVLDQSCERQVVKEIREVLPYIGIAVLSQALIVEAIAAKHRKDISDAVQDAGRNTTGRHARATYTWVICLLS